MLTNCLIKRVCSALRSLSVLPINHLSAFVLTLFISFSTQAATPFTTNGNFSVGSDGSANYSIPIQVPPGTSGMTPTLSLNYNSNGGNGILGMGWGLDGLSQISRCPKTIIQDGAVGGVNYDVNDKLCLDGQRLISTGGTYGGNATEYRTEQANFAKIISYTSTTANGPDYFKVWTKAGQIIEYGNSPDSRIEAAGKAVVRTWGVNKISDTKGNYLTVSYTEDNANGEAYIQRIDYTGNASSTPVVTPYASVQFSYETRPDISTGYHAGSVIKSTKRISNIKTYAPASTTNNTPTLVKDYRLTYEQGTATQRSRLKTLTECDGQTTPTCQQAVGLTWPMATANPATPSYTAPVLPATIGGYYSYHSSAEYMHVADFNGDGMTDYMWIPNNGDGRWLVAYSTGNGFTTPSYAAPALPLLGGYLPYHSTAHYMQFSDFNGDGKTDYMWIPSNGDGRWLVAYSTGNGFTTPSYTAPVLPATIGGYYSYHSSAEYMHVADFNGDGMTDYMWIPNNGDGRWLVAYSTGNGFTTPSYAAPALPLLGGYLPYHSTAHYMQFSDFNGDGKTDYMWIPSNGDGRWLVAYSTGNGFTTPSYTAPVLPATIGGYYSYHSSAQYMHVADFNGDGMTDYMWIPNNGDGRWLVAYSTGNGFTTPSYAAPALPLLGGYLPYHSTAHYMQFSDFNGDGKTDYMWIPSNGDGRWLVAYSTGNGFTTPSYTAPVLPATIGGYYSYHSSAQYMHVADFNGDGMTDYMWIPNNGDGRWLVAYSTGNGFTTPSYAAPALPLLGGYLPYHSTAHYMQFSDFNGDGKTDYMWIPSNSDGRWLVAYSPKDIDSVVSVSIGLSSTISLTYKPITDSSVYVKDTAATVGTTTCPLPVGNTGTAGTYPIVEVQEPMYVVSTATDSDGNGGVLTNNYNYGGLKAHVTGRGSLGFRYQKVTQVDPDINSTTFFRQDYPYIGLPCQTEKRITSSNTLIGASALTYANSPITTGNAISQFPYLSQAVEQSFELTGTLINSTTTTNQYDTYGNPTQISVNSGDGYVKTTTNVYNNDASNWLLGRLLRSTVTSTTP